MTGKTNSPIRGRLGHARVAVLAIIKEEFEAARDVLGLHTEVPNTEYVASGNPEDGRYDVVLCESTERSNIASTNRTTAIIDDFRPEVILLVGIAGGLLETKSAEGVFTRLMRGATSLGRTKEDVGRDGLSVGDVVVADYISYTEFMKVTNGRMSLRFLPVDHPSVHLRNTVIKPILHSFDLASAVKAERPDKSTKPRIFEGEIVSGEKVLSAVDDPIQIRLLAPFEKALAVDMESYGMARAVCEGRKSIWYNPRYLVIRGISDMVGSTGNNETRAKWKLYAAHTASHVAKAFVDRLLRTGGAA